MGSSVPLMEEISRFRRVQETLTGLQLLVEGAEFEDSASLHSPTPLSVPISPFTDDSTSLSSSSAEDPSLSLALPLPDALKSRCFPLPSRLKAIIDLKTSSRSRYSAFRAEIFSRLSPTFFSLRLDGSGLELFLAMLLMLWFACAVDNMRCRSVKLNDHAGLHRSRRREPLRCWTLTYSGWV